MDTPQQQPDAVEYSTVNLAGHDYTVRFTLGTLIRLEEVYGIDPATALAKAEVKGAEAIKRISTLLAAAISDQKAFTPDEVANLIDIRLLNHYTEAVNKALKPLTQTSPQATTETPAPLVN